MKWSDPRLKAGIGAALASVVLAGCTTSGPELTSVAVGCDLPDGAVAFVASGRANSPTVKDSPAVVAAVNHAIDNESFVTIVDSGGQPTMVASGGLESEAMNGPAREDEKKRFLNEVGGALQGVRSTTPEANPLEALGLAADSVRPHGSTGLVVLADSGLQTTGALNYTVDGMLTAEPSRLVEMVKGAGQLPDLTGMTVVLTGIGSTALPQESLDTATRARLQQQWVELATAAGAACVHLDTMPNSGPAPNGVPDVSEVDPPPPPVYDFEEPIPLREDVLAFRDNSPELVNEEASRAILEPLVEALQQARGKILLTGTTASGGTEEGRLQLSRERAETAKGLLVSMGVDAGRIEAEGVGTNFPGFQNDLDENGNQIEEIARQNRSVIVTVSDG